MIKFRAKNFSNYMLSDAATGAQAGAALGTLFAPFSVSALSKMTGRSWRGNWLKYTGGSIGAGLLAGSVLGLIFGAARQYNEKRNRATTVDDRLMKWITTDLKNRGFVEGRDFTRDPKVADLLRTRISIVVSRVNGDLQLVINAADDIKLSKLAYEVTSTLPSTSAKTEKVSDKYNELTITTVSNGYTDPGFVSGICEKIIRSGYPIYILEVG